MDRHQVEATMRILVAEIRIRLDEAAAAAKAAEICLNTGSMARGVEIALDIEQPIYEASRLLDATTLVNRIFSK